MNFAILSLSKQMGYYLAKKGGNSMANKLAREVAIIGVGYTPIGDVRRSPEIKDFTERELYAMAAIEAMKDAGIKAKDIDAYYVGSSGVNYDAKLKSPGPMFGDWIGMHNKPTLFHDEGCATSAFGLEMAVNAVASGKYDCVLTGAVNIDTCTPEPCLPPFDRKTMDNDTLWATVYTAFDPAYDKAAAGGTGCVEAVGVRYAIENNISLEDLDDAMAHYIYAKRREAVLNEKAIMCKMSYEQEAKMMHYDDPIEYIKSPKFNPLVGTILRPRYIGKTDVDAGGAIIVCTLEMAKKYKKDPILVAGIGSGGCLGPSFSVTDLDVNQRLFKEVYEMAGITDPASQIDYLSIHDCPVDSVLFVSEAAGYIPKGEAWKYMRDERMNFDGDKPINTTGGRSQSGHPRSPAFAIEVTEAVKQMRGENGNRQMAVPPKTSVLWAYGSAWNVGLLVLKKA